jgi:hypothetical protein
MKKTEVERLYLKQYEALSRLEQERLLDDLRTKVMNTHQKIILFVPNEVCDAIDLKRRHMERSDFCTYVLGRVLLKQKKKLDDLFS